MIPVLAPTVCLLVGVLIGLRLKHRRFLAERQKRREAERRNAMYDTQALRTDLDLVGPVTPPANVVELFDGDRLAGLREQAVDSADFYGLHSELPRPPLPMTGVRDTEAQDRELTEIYDIAPDGYCPVEGHHTAVGRRAHQDWLTWCTCGWEAESTNQTDANRLYHEHQQSVGQLGYQDWADAVRAIEDDGPETLPRSLPGRID